MKHGHCRCSSCVADAAPSAPVHDAHRGVAGPGHRRQHHDLHAARPGGAAASSRSSGPKSSCRCASTATFNGNSWGDGSEMSYPMYLEFRDHNAVFSGMFARFEWPMHVGTGRGDRARERRVVSGTYFPTLRRRPPPRADCSRQRTTRRPADTRSRCSPTTTGRPASAGDPAVVGRKLTVNSHPFTVIGVAAEGFSGIDVGAATQIFVPMMMKAQMTPGWNYLNDRRARFARVFARLKPGVDGGPRPRPGSSRRSRRSVRRN